MVFTDKKYSMPFLNLEEESMKWILTLFSFPIVELHEGLKYMAFILKPNAYTCKDWEWLIGNVKNMLSFWCH